MEDNEFEYYGIYKGKKLVFTFLDKGSEENWRDNFKGLEIKTISQFEYYQHKKENKENNNYK